MIGALSLFSNVFFAVYICAMKNHEPSMIGPASAPVMSTPGNKPNAVLAEATFSPNDPFKTPGHSRNLTNQFGSTNNTMITDNSSTVT
jgi:hypothetical protein